MLKDKHLYYFILIFGINSLIFSQDAISSPLDGDMDQIDLPAAVGGNSENNPYDFPQDMHLPETHSRLLPKHPLAELPFTVMTYGFVKCDYYWDSRQVFGNREDEALLWPLRKKFDPCGRDINSRAKFQFSPIETRVGFLIKGPPIGSTKQVRARAIIETDFFGLSETLLNQMRLRHAFFRLDFDAYDSNLIFGQFWHPLFQPDCFPRRLNFNLGIPFDTVARQPQIRYTQNFNRGSFIIAMLSQRDFQTIGPLGRSTTYLRNAKVPDFCADFRLYDASGNFLGCSVDYKRIAPRIVSNTGYAVKEYVDSAIAQGYMSLTLGNLTMNFKGIYAQNASDYNMISGFAVTCEKPITDFRTYTPTACFSVWNDSFYLVNYPECNFHMEYGIFIGGSKNLGSSKPLYIDPLLQSPIVFAIDPTLDYVWRVAPRILFKRYPVRFGVEFETTGASFGELTSYARVQNAHSVVDFRFLFIAYYVF